MVWTNPSEKSSGNCHRFNEICSNSSCLPCFNRRIEQFLKSPLPHDKSKNMADGRHPGGYCGRGAIISNGKPFERRPLRQPGETSGNNSGQGAQSHQDDGPKGAQWSALSPTAAEFVPRTRSVLQTENVVENGLDAGNDPCLEHIRIVMYEVTVNPGKFNTLAKLLVDSLRVMANNEETLKSVVDLIFEQGVVEPNFRYNGARLCNYLSKHLPPMFNNKTEFRTLLLRRCQQEFDKRDEFVKDAVKMERLRGYAFFLGELYVNLELIIQGTTPQRMHILAIAMLQLLELFLKNPIKENIKTVCQILKFSGATLEEKIPYAKPPITMDEIIQLMKEKAVDAAVEKNMKEMLLNVIELRASDWGRVSSSPAVREEPAVFDGPVNHPVFYGPDGIPLTEEEMQFLADNDAFNKDYDDDSDSDEKYGTSAWSAGDGEMDDEMAAAFEQFLLEQQHPPPHK